MRVLNRKSTASIAALCIGAFGATGAMATEGYFAHGYGARHSALGGAGVADTNDPTAISINPAGLVNAGNSFTAAFTGFVPNRGFTGAGGPSFTPGGTFDGNDTGLFVIPNFAYSREMGENTSFGISMYGNGGMNSDYEAVANPACLGGMTPLGDGVFCGGDTGVNLSQAFISAGIAHSYGKLSIGVAPIVAIQMFEAKGLAAFGGVTSDPANLTNRDTDYSFGGGVRVGVELAVTENVRIAGAYQSKIWMSSFDRYAGLFADGGDLDIPQSVNAGIAADLTPNLTIMFDYRWINYTGVNSVGNSTTTPLPFGAPDGPGFGWDDVNAYKVGLEWNASEDWTMRLGYAHNNNPIGPEDVTLNILAPGVVEDHITAGFEKKIGGGHALEFGFMYAPTSSVTGIEVTPFGPNPGHTIELMMDQYAITAGWKFNFGQ